MKPLLDYFYRFPRDRLRLPGRCRVRIYKRNDGAHAVVLTELSTNFGESIASACERIATGLAAARGLNPSTTRWIQHEPPQDDLPQTFDELHFSWDGNHTATDPKWQRLSDEQVETITGDSLGSLSRRLGDLGPQIGERTEHEGSEAKGAA